MPLGAACVLGLFLTGCGQSKSTEPGSVTGRSVPGRTVTLTVAAASMEPTLHCARPGFYCEARRADRVVVREAATDLDRQDIVAFRPPTLAYRECGTRHILIQRVIGLPGDAWEERDGSVYVDERKLAEPYIHIDRLDMQTLSLKDILSSSTRRIPKGMYLIMGDNRTASCDSRRFGLVPRRSVLGKVLEIRRPSG